ncbi:protein disulfide oxidoreductase [Campylobacter lari]|uniref:protein-disulfide oxidoreductase DsbI n=1 Tax=Campylobacter lari TaxID=201 RepID=UPI0021523A1F|nr:protein-disulfide oxidoreductase DsbI [Campylobacter lari]MCR6529628.1 protein-disulfide oxidoreductase DsbI [Campylobacter lari]
MSSCPVSRVSAWQNTRLPWLIMVIAMVGLTFIAHFLFQEYLYMEPCEQCVYIRFAMLTMAFGGILALIDPKNDYLKIFAYIFVFWGIWLGIEYCITLNHIHEVVHSENPFAGVDGCREIPIYPFNLPLHEWAPGWFLPTGECGMDTPIVPEDVYGSLNAFQKFFVGTPPNFEDGLYSNGWYLIPSMEFMNMAVCCLLAFVVCLVILGGMFISYAFSHLKAKIYALIVLVFVIILKILGEPSVQMA